MAAVQEHLARTRALDFDDLLLVTVRLFREHPKVRDDYRRRFRHVLVDEYQDTNQPVRDRPRDRRAHRNLCVVGDDDQSIYGWRGADIRKILHFARDCPEAKVVRLETNYRSTRPILDAANAVIRNNASRHDKVLESARGDGEPVRQARLKDETSEAQFVVGEISRVVKPGRAKPSDFAILCRTQVQFRPLETELRAAGLPYVLVGGMSFFDRKEVRDVVAYLKLAVQPSDETSLLRVINTPPRGVGKASLDKVVAFATSHGISATEGFERAAEVDGLAPQAVEGYRALCSAIERSGVAEAGRDLVSRLQALLHAIDYRGEVVRSYSDPMVREARWAGVEEILNFAENHVRRSAAPTLHGFLEELALSSGDENEEKRDEHADAVTLMTLHAAKGLEFPHVFLVGMEEGLLPHAKAAAEGSVDEERRLAYVGITRAMTSLTMTWAFERAKYGRSSRAVPSRFLFESEAEPVPTGWVGVEAMVARDEDEPAPAGRGRKKARRGNGARGAGRSRAGARR